jgi:hypothetical protein
MENSLAQVASEEPIHLCDGQVRVDVGANCPGVGSRPAAPGLQRLCRRDVPGVPRGGGSEVI